MTPKRKLLGWLVMKKVSTSDPQAAASTWERISVYKDGSLTVLIRYDRSGSYEHTVHEAAKGWLEEAALVWPDLQVEDGWFQPLHAGPPNSAHLLK